MNVLKLPFDSYIEKNVRIQDMGRRKHKVKPHSNFPWKFLYNNPFRRNSKEIDRNQ